MNHALPESPPPRSRGWLLVAAAIPLGMWCSTVGLMSLPRSMGRISLEAGREAFQLHCSACHFAQDGFPAHHGPNLHDIGRVAASRRPGYSAAAYILESILEPAAFVSPSSRPGMPNNIAAELSPDAIRNIVAYLVSLGGMPDYEQLAKLEIPDRRRRESDRLVVRRQDMELAVQILESKGACLRCHSRHSRPEYQVFAPGLFGVGLADVEHLRESITEPDKVVSARFRPVSLLLRNGQQLTGKLVSQTESQLVLFHRALDGSLERKHLPADEVEQEDGRLLIQESSASEMPTGYARTLSPAEIEALITLIRQLN